LAIGSQYVPPAPPPPAEPPPKSLLDEDELLLDENESLLDEEGVSLGIVTSFWAEKPQLSQCWLTWRTPSLCVVAERIVLDLMRRVRRWHVGQSEYEVIQRRYGSFRVSLHRGQRQTS